MLNHNLATVQFSDYQRLIVNSYALLDQIHPPNEAIFSSPVIPCYSLLLIF
ncbi:MAG: hypothetical protein AAF388_24570 [Bacteroidota bacterium]